MRVHKLVILSLSLHHSISAKREYGTRVDCVSDEVKYDKVLRKPLLTVKRLTICGTVEPSAAESAVGKLL